MGGLAGFHHDIIGHIDDVIDAANADGLQPLLHPFRRGTDLDTLNDAGGVAVAQGWLVDLDLYHRLCIAVRFVQVDRGNFQFCTRGCGQFPGDSNMPEAVAAVTGDLHIQHGVVADLLGFLDRKAEIAENLAYFIRRQVRFHIITQPIQRNLH